MDFQKFLFFSESSDLIWLSRKHLHAKVTPSLHLKYSKIGGKPGIGIGKHKISFFFFVVVFVFVFCVSFLFCLIVEKYPIFMSMQLCFIQNKLFVYDIHE